MINPSDEIKSKLDITEVLGEYISFRPAGANLRAVCPFHQEKTPSFMISPEKQIWHCFGCGKGGDIFGFVMEMEGLTFPEALRLLAPKAGVTLRSTDIEAGSKRNRLLDVMEAANDYYHRQMLGNSIIKDYLKNRGLQEETVRSWKIGYSPNSWDDLYSFLRSKKYSDEEIFSAGLSVKKDGASKYYNRFRDRVMFPINDIAGQAIGFSARINPAEKNLEAQKMGKYINSPQTSIYDKSRVLFGLDRAKGAIKAQDLAIIVEGQMDAITLHQGGYKNVVASSGTALTGEQIKLLKRYTNNLAMAFDADAAGQLAADRGIAEALAQEVNVKVIVVPSGKDPDECLKNSPTEWEAAVKEAPSVMDYYFTKIFKDFDINKVEDKRGAAKKILLMVAKLSNKVEIDHWLKRLAEKIDVDENLLRETLKTSLGEVRRPGDGPSQINAQRNAPVVSESWEEKLSALLLALMLKYPDFIPYVAHNVEIEHLAGLAYRLFYNELIIYYNDNSQIEYQKFRAYLKDKEVSHVALLDTLSLLADKDMAEAESGQIKNEIIKIILSLKRAYYKTQMKTVEKAISQAEQKNEPERVTSLMQDFKTLSEKIKELDI
jgi:DNA primase